MPDEDVKLAGGAAPGFVPGVGGQVELLGFMLSDEEYALDILEIKEIVRLQRSYHVISLDNDFDLVVDRVVRFVRKVGCAREPQAGTASAQYSRR